MYPSVFAAIASYLLFISLPSEFLISLVIASYIDLAVKALNSSSSERFSPVTEFTSSSNAVFPFRISAAFSSQAKRVSAFDTISFASSGSSSKVRLAFSTAYTSSSLAISEAALSSEIAAITGFTDSP